MNSVFVGKKGHQVITGRCFTMTGMDSQKNYQSQKDLLEFCLLLDKICPFPSKEFNHFHSVSERYKL